MNILFVTLLDFDTLNERTIYTDLLREFIKNGHKVYAVSPVEKRKKTKAGLIREDGVVISKPVIGNIQKTGIIEKGISTISVEPLIRKAIKKSFPAIRFDLVIYSTPPITFLSAIEYVKKRDKAKTYLLLKDIFPQNALDIGLLSKKGPKGLIYRHFRRQEKKLYAISDRIGCMSKANADYIIRHNRDIDSSKVEVCPNSIEIVDKRVDEKTRESIRKKYAIPADKKVFIYGGNLGKPQGVPYIVECLKQCNDIEEAFFLIVGSGTDYDILADYATKAHQKNFRLMKSLPKEDYDNMVGACDVGMIFLDHRFTIPNFPSRLLSYMQAGLPVLACTDPNTDVGRVIEDGGFGWWCESNDPCKFKQIIIKICKTDSSQYKNNAFSLLEKEYTTKKGYEIIMKRGRR